MRRWRRAGPGALLTVALAVLAAVAPAGATAEPIGYDIAYPLCGLTLPAGGAFGIVGVNGGLANNPNPCLAGELTWATGTPGAGTQPAVSVYINTADPGSGVADWPTPATGSRTASTPYGACDGTWTPACGYLYGALRAAYSYALLAAAGGAAPARVSWWLDVETVSTWARPTSLPGWAAANIATIQGFVAGLRSSGAGGPIGFYSTRAQWLAITGLDPTSTPGRLPATLPDWVAGTGTLADAQAHCQDSFTGGTVRLTQFAASGLDGDYACPPPAPPGLRVRSHLLRGGALRVGGTISPAYRGLLTVELTATAGRRPFALRRTGAVAGGRWQVVLPLPPRLTLRGGLVVVSSSARDGLSAGAVRFHARLSA